MLEKASDGDTISLEPGEYFLDSPLQINKNINLSGATGDPTDVIICSRFGAAAHVSAQAARISAVTFSNQQADEQEGSIDFLSSSIIVIEKGESEIVNCVVTGKGDGIVISGEQAAPIIRYTKIFNCTSGGVWIIRKARAVIYRSELAECGHSILAVCDQSAVKVIKSNIHHGRNIGAYVFQNSFGRFRECTFHHNALAGIEIKNGSDCVCEDCTMHHNGEHGICAWNESRGRFEHCDIHGNGSSQVMSLGSRPHLISCTVHDSDSIGIWLHRESSGQLDSCEVYKTRDAAVVVSEDSDPVFSECAFHHSHQTGVMCVLDARGRFDNCEIFLCQQGGALIADKAEPTFIDCNIHHNRECGVYIYQKGEGKFYNNIFFDNDGQNWKIERDAGSVVREDNSPNW